MSAWIERAKRGSQFHGVCQMLNSQLCFTLLYSLKAIASKSFHSRTDLETHNSIVGIMALQWVGWSGGSMWAFKSNCLGSSPASPTFYLCKVG